MNRRRTRTSNGIQRKRNDDFYCVYGKHYLLGLEFETNPENKGICIDCAFAVHELLYGKVSSLPELTPREIIRVRETWGITQERKKSIAALRRGSNDAGWVYYVAQADLIKIGYAADVTSRIKHYGPTATLLAVHPGTPKVEKQMHARFKNALHSGREWFRRDADLLAHIESVLNEFGNPGVFEYQWTKPKTEEEKVRSMVAPKPDFPSVAVGAHSAR